MPLSEWWGDGDSVRGMDGRCYSAITSTGGLLNSIPAYCGVGLVVGGLMQLRVFGCSFGWELWRCMVSISDSTLVALVEAPVSPVFSSSSFTTRGSSEIRQQKSRVLVRNALGGAHPDCYQLHWIDLSLLFSCIAGMFAVVV